VWLFTRPSKKVSKEMTALAAGMTVRLVGWLIQSCCLECCASLIQHSVFDEAAEIFIDLFFISAADSTAVVFKSIKPSSYHFDCFATLG
jgi:hypothetical protein